MTIEEYFAAVRRLGLKPSAVPGIYFTSTMDVHSVPDPTNMTPEQRAETIERKKAALGIAPPSGRFN
jgi:hypothetical protein